MRDGRLYRIVDIGSSQSGYIIDYMGSLLKSPSKMLDEPPPEKVDGGDGSAKIKYIIRGGFFSGCHRKHNQ